MAIVPSEGILARRKHPMLGEQLLTDSIQVVYDQAAVGRTDLWPYYHLLVEIYDIVHETKGDDTAVDTSATSPIVVVT